MKILSILIASTILFTGCFNATAGMKTYRIPKYKHEGNPYKNEILQVPLGDEARYICLDTKDNERLEGWYINATTYKRFGRTKSNLNRSHKYIEDQCEGKRVLTREPTNDGYYITMITSLLAGIAIGTASTYLIMK